MANKYEKGEFEEYFHVNPKFSRTGPDMFGQKNRRQGLPEKRIVYTVIGFTRIVCRFRYNP